jgi:hypothetical protein
LAMGHLRCVIHLLPFQPTHHGAQFFSNRTNSAFMSLYRFPGFLPFVKGDGIK